MTLATDVVARVPEQVLVHWTNPNDNTATTVDTTYLGTVCDDVQADIEVELGLEYQGVLVPARDLAWQKAQAVLGVMIRLEWYATISSPDIERKYQNWITALQRRRRRATVTPGTDAKGDVQLPASDDRGDFDRRDQGGWLAGRGGVAHPGVGREEND